MLIKNRSARLRHKYLATHYTAVYHFIQFELFQLENCGLGRDFDRNRLTPLASRRRYQLTTALRAQNQCKQHLEQNVVRCRQHQPQKRSGCSYVSIREHNIEQNAVGHHARRWRHTAMKSYDQASIQLGSARWTERGWIAWSNCVWLTHNCVSIRRLRCISNGGRGDICAISFQQQQFESFLILGSSSAGYRGSFVTSMKNWTVYISTAMQRCCVYYWNTA